MLKHLFIRRIAVAPVLGLLACICLVLSACQKEYSVETNISLAAKGTLKDTTTGECNPDVVTGTFYGGIEPGRDTAYVTVSVTVTNPGTYNIYTDTQDGFYFSDSGYFATTGLNIIKLKPVGTPIIPGPVTFNITFDTSICTFSFNVQDSTGTGLGGGGTTNPNLDSHAWQFTSPSGSYNGPIAEASEGDTTINTVSFHYLYILAPTAATGDSAMQFIVNFPFGAVTPGTYKSDASVIFNFQSGLTGDVIYAADPTTTQKLTIIITSYNAATGIVSGSFSGDAKDASGNAAAITNGQFTAKVQ